MPDPTPLADVLGAAVYAAGSRVGVVGDVFADPTADHVIGLEVVGPNGRHWYLPWAAATFEHRRVRAASPLVFMAVEQVAYYIEHGARLTRNDVDGTLVGGDGRLAKRPNETVVSHPRREGIGVT